MYENSSNNPFAGLPVTLVNELLSKSGIIADEIYGPFREIQGDRDKLRKQLQEHNIIQNDSLTEGLETLTSCGVDGYYTVEKLLTNELVCCAAFAVEGLIPQSGKKHWENPSYKTLFHTDRYNSETKAISKAIMMQMSVELAAGAPHEIILLGKSFVTPFISIMETLRLALKSKESVTGEEFIKRIKSSILSFKTIFDPENSEKMWAGIPGNMSHKELINKLDWPHHYNDTILFTILLSPGEFTTPVPVEYPGLSQVKNLSIKDEKFAAVRDSLVSSISELHFIYYRPYNWTPVFRIEIAPSIARDSSKYALLLNSIKFQCSSAGIMEPYPVYGAGRMVKSLNRAMPSLRKSALSHIAGLHKGDLGEILPLLLFKDSDRGNDMEK